MGKDDDGYNVVLLLLLLLPEKERETEERCREPWLVLTAKLTQYFKNSTAQKLYADTEESTMAELGSKIVEEIGE